VADKDYFCITCMKLVSLTAGSCAECNGASVLAESVIRNNPTVQAILDASRQLSEQTKPENFFRRSISRPAVLLPNLTLYRVTCGKFYCTLLARSVEDALSRAGNVEETWQLDEQTIFERDEVSVGVVDRSRRLVDA